MSTSLFDLSPMRTHSDNALGVVAIEAQQLQVIGKSETNNFLVPVVTSDPQASASATASDRLHQAADARAVRFDPRDTGVEGHCQTGGDSAEKGGDFMTTKWTPMTYGIAKQGAQKLWFGGFNDSEPIWTSNLDTASVYANKTQAEAQTLLLIKFGAKIEPVELRCPHSVMSEVGCRRCTGIIGHSGECEFAPPKFTGQTHSFTTDEQYREYVSILFEEWRNRSEPTEDFEEWKIAEIKRLRLMIANAAKAGLRQARGEQ